MLTTIIRSLACLGAAIALACATPAAAHAQVDTTRVVQLKRLEVSARRRPLRVGGVFRQAMRRDSALAVPVRASGGRRLVVEGAAPTPSACYRLAGAADRAGQDVIILVQARPAFSHCPDVPEVFTYKLSMRLPPGTYTLHVLHGYRDERWPTVVALDTTVTIR